MMKPRDVKIIGNRAASKGTIFGWTVFWGMEVRQILDPQEEKAGAEEGPTLQRQDTN